MIQPDVSVVIPCYNVERYLPECLASAMSQTLKNIELICVNDGSTDGTMDLLRAAAKRDPRIVIIDKPNEGYGRSMNRGFGAATGRYIAILESDDFMDPTMLEDLYRTAVEYDYLDVVKSNFYFYWSVPEPRNEYFDLLKEEECGHVLRPFNERNVFYVKPSIWSAIYRTDFIRRANIRFNETPGASYQDASFNFQVWLHARRVMFLHEAYLHYRQDNEASSVNSPGKVYCVCDEYEKIFQALSEYPNQEEARDLVTLVVKMKFDSYMWNYERLTPELGREFLDKVQEEFDGHIERGELDWSFLDEYQTWRLKMILDDPGFYHMIYADDSDESGKMRTIKRYWKAGGLSYLKKLLAYKMS